MNRPGWTAVTAAFLSVATLAATAVIDAPFVVWTPGGTVDLLSTGEQSVIRVTDQATFPTSGRLLLTGVQQTPPDGQVSVLEAIQAYWSHDMEVMPRAAVYPPGSSADSVLEDQAQRMTRSQSNAVSAALQAAGIRVDPVPVVSDVNATGPAADLVQAGDVLVALQAAGSSTITVVRTVGQANSAIASVKPGTELELTLQRLEHPLKVTVRTEASQADPNTSVAGLTLAQGYLTTPDVAFTLPDDTAGDTAGLMFALAVYDKVTANPMLRDRVVAGAGTVNAEGQVGRVDAVRERIGAAERAGASVFLIPRANCADVGDEVPTVRLVAVTNLTEAISAVEALADPAREAAVKGC